MAIFCAPEAHAQATFPAKPDKAHFYVDEANLIDAPDRDSIDKIAGELLKEEKVPILVVTIASMLNYGAAGYSIERYAQELFDNWGIGFKDRNYGILLLVSRGDRKARIELGAGWGHTHDTQSQQVMDKLIVSEFKKGNYSAGILAGVGGPDAMARGLALPKAKQPWWVPVVFIGGIVLVVGIIYSLFKNGQKGWGWALIAALGVLLFFILRAASKSGGSGGSFGGGSSGGGRASGSW